ncbi:MAG: M90 family metallopeptidase [Planctomycetaceae bacterium]|nr:M90 family metallopeptidase [Planctomycetaceae bacterium]
MWNWWTARKRRKWAELPFPQDWEETLHSEYAEWSRISPEMKSSIKRFILIFIREKNWEGCGGLQLTDSVKVLISAQVGMMVSTIGPLYFDHVLSILVYPDAYRAPNNAQNQTGIVNDQGSARMGEAWWQGPVILSWRHTLEGARNIDTENLVYHEFSHQIDMMNGRFVDGTPPLASEDEYRKWSQVMNQGYEQLRARIRQRQPSVIRRYGLTNPGEFFAVSTEAFFSAPGQLLIEYPEVYQSLMTYYGQDPASRRVSLSEQRRA